MRNSVEALIQRTMNSASPLRLSIVSIRSAGKAGAARAGEDITMKFSSDGEAGRDVREQGRPTD
jgi:hypothetical protein